MMTVTEQPLPARLAIDRELVSQRMKYFVCPDGNTRQLSGFTTGPEKVTIYMKRIEDSETDKDYTYPLETALDTWEKLFSQVPRSQAAGTPDPTTYLQATVISPPVTEKPAPEPQPVIALQQEPAHAGAPQEENQQAVALTGADNQATLTIARQAEELVPTKELAEGLMNMFNQVLKNPTELKAKQALALVAVADTVIDVYKLKLMSLKMAQDFQKRLPDSGHDKT